MERIDTVIVGGGQAGLAMSHQLRRRGCEHVVLERARVAERWRTERWDSLRFQFPNWSIELPGLRYDHADRDAYAHKDEVLAFLEMYCARIDAPIRTGIAVRALRASSPPYRYALRTDGGEILARNVVVATGPYQRARIPRLASGVANGITQLHASEYRNPDELPPGGVLVVGSGASGCQIAEELLARGRRAYLSVGRHRRVPRRYRGRDAFFWRRAIGELDRTADAVPPEARLAAPLVTGVGGGHTIDLRDYAKDGMTLLGHLVAIDGMHVRLARDLETNLAAGDRTFEEFVAAVDDYVTRADVSCGPPDCDPRTGQAGAASCPDELQLDAAGVTAIVWATGYRLDFGWIDPAILDQRGAPLHRRGVTAAPGLYFLGLAWLHKPTSSFLCGVGEDADYLATQIARAG